MDALDELMPTWADGKRIVEALYEHNEAQAILNGALAAATAETPFAETHAKALVGNMRAKATKAGRSKSDFGIVSARDTLRWLATLCDDEECGPCIELWLKWRGTVEERRKHRQERETEARTVE